MELKLKGTSQVSLRKLVQKQGPAFEKAYLEKLSPPQVKDYNCLAVSWIPLETDSVNNSLVILADMLYPNNRLAVRKVGQDLAKIALPAFYQVFLRIPTPEFVFKRVTNIWASYYNKGTSTMEKVGDKKLLLTLADFPDYPAYLFEFVTGFLMGMAEIIKLKNFKVYRSVNDDPSAWHWNLIWE